MDVKKDLLSCHAKQNVYKQADRNIFYVSKNKKEEQEGNNKKINIYCIVNALRQSLALIMGDGKKEGSYSSC